MSNHSTLTTMNRRLLHLLLPLTVVICSCMPPGASGPEPDHLVYLGDGDSLSVKLVRGEVLVTRVVTEEGDSLALENASIDRIIHLRSGRDVSDRYIDREALKVELAKQAALARREKLESEVAAGKRKKSELNRIPFAVLAATLEHPEGHTPRIALTILNLTDKKIDRLKTRVHCFDDKGRPVTGRRGRDHIFDATSRVPIGPGEDFTTLLVLRNHARTKTAKVEIHYLEFSDRTWWKGKVEESVK